MTPEWVLLDKIVLVTARQFGQMMNSRDYNVGVSLYSVIGPLMTDQRPIPSVVEQNWKAMKSFYSWNT